MASKMIVPSHDGVDVDENDDIEYYDKQWRNVDVVRLFMIL